ncbi:MAG TPA: cytochrome c biogenesis heme-transporting ATPase CcmA, partial [Casimicrobiaceae bacterium]
SRLFTGLAFRLEPGHALLVTGANGTGKTTLLRILAGLSQPTEGRVQWKGAPITQLESRRDIAFAGHLPALKDELTAEENLASLVELAGEKPDPKSLRVALASVALEAQRVLPARVLSQGQRRRINLARLTLVRRALWLLDEPVTALDTAGVALMAGLVTHHLEQGGCVVAATHQALVLPPERMRSLALA